nr:hypothetical protein GCM10025732_12340 [Glycomyces mayteni]
MERLEAQTLLQAAAAGKLRSSMCQQVMAIEYDRSGQVLYRCARSCGKHTADAVQVQAGLLWHYRGRSLGEHYGLPDEDIVDDMFASLQLAWIRDGDIYTARFRLSQRAPETFLYLVG